MQSFADIINAFKTNKLSGPAVLAAEFGEEPGTVRQWRNRDTLPDRKWKATVEAAQRRFVQGVTLEVLATIAARKAGEGRASPGAEATSAAGEATS